MVTKEGMLLQLTDLEGWAGFIFESLTAPRAGEAGKSQVLEQLLGGEQLRGLRREAYVLMDHLHVLIAEARSRAPVSPMS